MPTFYDTLDISAEAKLSEIRAAYLKKAMKYHPDRGGSHAEMVIVNEAWEVLSDTKSRKKYDQLLATNGNTAGMFAAARSRAANYPKTWAKFDKWFSAIGKDFTDAEYGEAYLLGMGVPTGGKSFSGWLFIVAGGIVGAVIAGSIYQVWTPEPIENPFGSGFIKPKHPLNNPAFLRFGGLGSVAVGAWLGNFLHRAFGSVITLWYRKATVWWPAQILSLNLGSTNKQSTLDSVQSHHDEPKRFKCVQCGEELKPSVNQLDAVTTCPKCSNKIHPSFKTSDKLKKLSSMQFPPNSETIKSVFKNLLIIEISLTALSIALMFIEIATLSELMLENEEIPEWGTAISSIYVLLLIILIPAQIITWVGMFNLKGWSRWSYLAIFTSDALFAVLSGTSDYSIHWQLVPALEGLTSACSGAIIAIAFLSPLAVDFHKNSNVSVPSP